MPEPPNAPPWKGREMRWTIAVNEHEGSLQATLAWANDGEVLATAQAGEAAECIAAVAAALTSLTGRLQVAKGVERIAEGLLASDDEEGQQSDRDDG
jgi:hypothetical protein